MTQDVKAVPTTAKVIVLTGPFGGGKTVTALSFVPPTWQGGTVKRLVIDPEMRTSSHRSEGEADDFEHELFSFIPICEGRFDPQRFVALATQIHQQKYPNGKPDVVIMDDTGMFQEAMIDFWQDKTQAQKAVDLYGIKAKQMAQRSWRPSDPGVIALVFKRIFEEFILDLRVQGIFLVLTSPLRNVWQNYGDPGYDEQGKPKMRIIARSVKVLDIWLKHADWIGNLTRLDEKTRKLSQLPRVSMDPYNPKNSITGLPAEFEWPGWPVFWKWHRDRQFVADVSKLVVPDPEYDQESLASATRTWKVKLYKDLEGIATIDQINTILTAAEAPAYSVETHGEIVNYVKRLMQERTK